MRIIIYERFMDAMILMTGRKKMIATIAIRTNLLAILTIFSINLVSTVGFADVPLKESNPGIPGLLSDLAVTIDKQQLIIDDQELEFIELMNKIASLKATIESQDEIISTSQERIEELEYLIFNSAPSPVPKTGHTEVCWRLEYLTGLRYEEIDCVGTGQDGEDMAGIENPNPRFSDNGDGTVTDKLTGLIWLQNATCIEGFWEDALVAVKSLGEPQCYLTDGSTPGDWRAANVKELQSLIDYGYSGLPEGHPFIAIDWPPIEERGFWSSTDDMSYTYYPGSAYIVTMFSGETISTLKHRAEYDSFNNPRDVGTKANVWPVRGGSD